MTTRSSPHTTRDTPVARASHKAIRRLVPFLLLMYVMAFIDRANVGFAKQALKDTVGISDMAFAFGASVFFIAYVLAEIPSNIMLHKVGARLWLARIMVTWGLVSAATLFVDSATSFYVLRFILGACEAGFFPGVILYLTYWFPDHYRTRVTGLFYIGAPLAFMLGAPLSGFLLRIDAGGLLGYQWMFLIEGLGATAVGIWAFFYLPSRPTDARWLSAEEQTELTACITREQQAKMAHGPRTMLASMRDARVLYFALIFFLIQMGVAVIVFYLPTFISRVTGALPGTLVGFMVAVPWTCALLATLAVPKLAARHQHLVGYGAACLVVAAAGMAASASASPALALGAMCVAVAGIWAAQPIFWSLLTNYLGGAAAVAGVAFVNCVANIGNFLSPNVKALADVALQSEVGGLLVLAGVVLLAAVLYLGLGRHARREATTASESPVPR
ncbi:MFS transporter [Pseudomonas sp. NPDC007930]|uniref:MFS transporter n=1 Tax=Pseudomonas sp. NPDC007930 TaxID=3364417 RepID=UPI0036E435DB